MAGFGHSSFGQGPFGISDVGTDLIVDAFPVEYLEDAVPEGVDPFDDSQNLLLQMLKTMARMINVARTNTDNMQQLSDYVTAPSDILLLLGDNFGLDIDQHRVALVECAALRVLSAQTDRHLLLQQFGEGQQLSRGV